MEVNYEEVIAGKEKIGGSKESIGVRVRVLSPPLSFLSSPSPSPFQFHPPFSRLLLRFQPKRKAKAWLGCPGHPEKERERERSKGLLRL